MHYVIRIQTFKLSLQPWICLIVSIVFALIPALILKQISSKRLQAEIEYKILKKREREAKRKREEEVEKKRSFEEKLAILNENEQKTMEKHNKTLHKVKQEYSHYRSINSSDPEDLFLDHRNSDPESIFSTGLGDAFSGGGVERAKAYYQELVDIFNYYAARYMVEVCKAKIADSKSTFIKKRAILYAEKLKEIYSKLTGKQKMRKVENMASKFKIGNTSIKIVDSLKSVDVKISEQREIMKSVNRGLLKDYTKYSREFDSEAVAAGTFLLGMAVGNLVSNYEDRKEIKYELNEAYNKLIRKLEKIEADRIKAAAFEKRINEINKSISKALEAYTKIFDSVYAALYPQDNPSMSKEQRQFRKNNGNTYFTDEEAEEVIQLGRIGQFLLDLVDTNL
jgi:hypothetical protein